MLGVRLIRHLTGPAALGAVLLVLGGCTSTTQGVATVPAPTASTGVGQPSPFLGANLASVGCGTTLRCAAGAVSFDPNPSSAPLTTSDDGGLSWHHATGSLPASAEFLSVGCAATVCMAAGRSLYGALAYVSAKPGAPWKQTSSIGAGSVTQSVACAGLRWCMALVSGSTHVFSATTLSAGGSWTAGGSLPDGTGTIQRLSCSSTTHCLAAGSTSTGQAELAMTADGGATWTASSLPSSPVVVGVVGAACRVDATCLAVVTTNSTGASTIIESTDGGATFTELLDPSTGPLSQPQAVSCVATTCVIVGRSSSGAGAALQMTTNEKSRPFSLSYVPTALLAVSCPTAARCVAATTASLVVLSPSVPQTTQH